jgi:RHS repeat-associated protein
MEGHWTTTNLAFWRVGPLILILLSVTAATAQAPLFSFGQGAADSVLPAALTPGAPSGSYKIGDFEQINLLSGHLNVALPLMSIGGRGQAGYTMMAQIGTPTWAVQTMSFHDVDITAVTGYADYFAQSASIAVDLQPYYPGYGPGVVAIKRAAIDPVFCGPDTSSSIFTKAFTYVVFISPDGTEHALFDTANLGVRDANCGSSPLPNRDSTFAARDGSGITFVSSAMIADDLRPDAYPASGLALPAGYLMMPDGTRYDVQYGYVTRIRDRNGNVTTFTYEQVMINGQFVGTSRVTSILDPLGRTTMIAYDIPDALGERDEITFKGAGGVLRTIKIVRAMLPVRLRPGYTIPQSLFPELPDSCGFCTPATDPSSMQVTARVVIPDGRSYEFYYNPYGEVAKVVLPTGGAVEYDHGSGLTPNASNGIYESGQVLDKLDNIHLATNLTTAPRPVPWQPFIYRRLKVRREYPDGSTLALTTTYTGPEAVVGAYTYPYTPYDPVWALSTPSARKSGLQLSNTGYVEVSQQGLNITPTTERHWFYPDGSYGGPVQAMMMPTNVLRGVPWPFAHKEYKTELVGLRTEERAWGLTSSQAELPTASAQVCQVRTTLGSKTSGRIVQYDRDANGTPLQPASIRFENATDVYEYNYDQAPAFGPSTYIPQAGNLAGYPPYPDQEVKGCSANTAGYYRRTHTDFVTDATYTGVAVHLRRLPSGQVVRDGSSNVAAQTTFYYDEQIPDSRSNMSGRSLTNGIDDYGTGYRTRGNLTRISRWLNLPVQTWLDTRSTYDIVGNVVSAADALNNTTTFSYNDSFSTGTDLAGKQSYAFVTTVNLPLLPGDTQRSRSMSYDYYTGKLTSSTDLNGLQTGVYFTGDLLDRPHHVTRGDSTTTFNYQDASRQVQTTSSLFGSTSLSRTVTYDGLGRTTQVANGTSSSVMVDTVYDGLGRVRQTSNPHQSTGQATDGWSTFEYDGLGRVTRDIQPDGTYVQTSYAANTATVTDQASVSRVNETDALGRLTKVTESNIGVITTYGYDVLDNLTSVTQGSQLRSFTYDSLSRLRTATNPEISGAVTYTYYANGNLAGKTEPGGATAASTFYYDAWNRLTQKAYADGMTPTAYFCYDGLATSGGPCVGTRVFGSVGHQTGFGNSVSWTNQAVDSKGRVTSSVQTTALPGGGTRTDSFGATYFSNDSLSSLTYPSGRTVTTCYDDQGRVIWASQVRTVADCTSGNWAGKAAYGDVTAYWPHGAMKTLSYGNGLVESSQYASRLQPQSLSLGGVWQVAYEYGATDNNGNVRKQTLTVPGMSTITQAYKYDGANRLEVVAEQPVNPAFPACNSSGDITTGGWCHRYQYDTWGNRTVPGYFGTTLPITTPTAYSNNRILGANWGYTARGEINLDPLARTFAYDAEGHIKQTTGANGTTVYSYDAQGQRVRKDTPGGSTVYAYDVLGSLGAEYSTVAQSASCQTCYLTPDHLGSTRVVTGPTGQPVARHDYEPFGGEISLSTSSPRYGVAGYGAPDTDVAPRFTGQLRDLETNLDHFGGRYYTEAQGRWTSPDLINITNARIFNPSNTLNKYVYAANNPLKYVDADGEDITIFYRQPAGRGDFGHVFVAAVNQVTREVELLDYWSKNGTAFGKGEVNRGDFRERVGNHASLTIQTTPEVAQKALAFIKKFKSAVPDYNVFSSSCVTSCRAVLELAGINVFELTPSGVWANLYSRYSTQESFVQRMLSSSIFGAPVMPKYAPGREFGNPRDMGQDSDWQRFLFSLWLQQIERDRERSQKGYEVDINITYH